jgi:hypothetical protein
MPAPTKASHVASNAYLPQFFNGLIATLFLQPIIEVTRPTMFLSSNWHMMELAANETTEYA